jgi:ABC-type amino acid transport substrate-binding protein
MRGAFSNYPPAFINDNGIFSGIFCELIKGFAEELGVKLEFAEETGYGVIVGGLNEGRFDIFCSAVWPTPERLLEADFSIPLYYSDAFMWVREGDTRFDSRATLNNPFFRIAIKENDISDSIARADFPNARRVRVPQLNDTIKLLEFVSQDKADATFAESYLVEQHNKTTNVKLVAAGKPVREYPNTFMFRKGEVEFKKAIDGYLQRNIDSGFFLKLVKKYVGNEKVFKLEKKS